MVRTIAVCALFVAGCSGDPGRTQCNVLSASATVQLQSGANVVAPQNGSLGCVYERQGSNVAFLVTMNDTVVSSSRKSGVDLHAVVGFSTASLGATGSVTSIPWAWITPMQSQSTTRYDYLDQFAAAHVDAGTGSIAASLVDYDITPNVSEDSRGLAGATINVANAKWPRQLGDTGGVTLSSQMAALQDGSSITFNFNVALSIVPSMSAAGAGVCPDNGMSCSSNPRVVDYTNQCQNSVTGAQAACYCASAATAQCFLNDQCYVEAGAPTQTTQGELQNLRDMNSANAAQLGTTCMY